MLLEEKVAKLEREIEAIKSLMKKIAMPHQAGTQKMKLENVTTIIDVEEIEKQVTIKTDTVAGKILSVAKKGKLDSWLRLGDIVKAITEESWTVTSQAINGALKDLVKQDIIAKKHTDRNYFKLAKNVVFA